MKNISNCTNPSSNSFVKIQSALGRRLRRLSAVAGLFMLAILNLSFVPARYDYSDLAKVEEGYKILASVNPFSFDPISVRMINTSLEIYDSLALDEEGLSYEAFNYALKGYEKLLTEGKIKKASILTIADFSQPSTEKRLYILDLNDYKLRMRTYVSHGRNSGALMAESFSNRVSSYQSSLGFYVTDQTYRGKHGYSLRLEGQEKGINDNARKRAIVMHPADYADGSIISRLGYLGRSQGCPAVPPSLHKTIINEIKDGSCFFIYHPSSSYVNRSMLLN